VGCTGLSVQATSKIPPMVVPATAGTQRTGAPSRSSRRVNHCLRPEAAHRTRKQRRSIAMSPASDATAWARDAVRQS
jgi:hypothetical protein